MTIWSELGVFLPFLYAFFFSMKSELWILASHIWPADIMDYGHIKQSLGLYFRSAHVSEPSEEITHRSFTESLSCYKTINPFCKWLIQHLTLYWEYICTGHNICPLLPTKITYPKHIQNIQHVRTSGNHHVYKFQLSNTNQ